MSRKSKLDIHIFRQRYSLPLEAKVLWAQSRVREFYNHFGGDVFLSFSGGKDSQVLAEILREMGKPYSDIELVFFDTLNENRSVHAIVERYGATVVKGEETPKQVFERVGYPLFNKQTAHIIDGIQRNVPYTNNPNAVDAKLVLSIRERYADFINSPLRITDKCCDVLKKCPSLNFTKRTGKFPIIATLAVESQHRLFRYLDKGCNSFEGKIQCLPLSIFSKQNILDFIANRELRIASCYGMVLTKGLIPGINRVCLMGVDQTGCMSCGFGKGEEFAYKVLKAKCPEYYATLDLSNRLRGRK